MKGDAKREEQNNSPPEPKRRKVDEFVSASCHFYYAAGAPIGAIGPKGPKGLLNCG